MPRKERRRRKSPALPLRIFRLRCFLEMSDKNGRCRAFKFCGGHFHIWVGIKIAKCARILSRPARADAPAHFLGALPAAAKGVRRKSKYSRPASTPPFRAPLRLTKRRKGGYAHKEAFSAPGERSVRNIRSRCFLQFPAPPKKSAGS